MTELKQIPIEKLKPDPARGGYRKDNPNITPTFVESIKTGLRQSLLVRTLEEGKYGIIHGVRRFMAVKRYTEMESLPCIVLHDIEDKEVLPLWFRLNEGERGLPKETVEEIIQRRFHNLGSQMSEEEKVKEVESRLNVPPNTIRKVLGLKKYSDPRSVEK